MDFYEINAKAYIEETKDLDMTAFYGRFLPVIPKGGRILDAGCGSARDALYFHQRGFKVTAFDQGEEIVKLAQKATGLLIEECTFEEITEVKEYDGIWASASLLHCSKEELPSIFVRLHRALKDSGILYASFKEGASFTKDGLPYTSFTHDEFIHFIHGETDFQIIEIVLSEDLRTERRGEYWLNAYLQKKTTDDSVAL